MVAADTPRTSRRGAMAFIATFVVLFSVLSITAPTARAAEAGDRSSAGALAWSPDLNPLDTSGGRETVHRHLTTQDRNTLLDGCPYENVCVAAGEGDGRHTVWKLYYCTRRSLTQFNGDGAIYNHQKGSVSTILLDKNGRAIPGWGTITAGQKVRVTWDSVWYIDVC
jgi:hypothetical protein